ncbi:MAG TPA: hypothetical protein VKU01_13245 [Bryobacteraceae bacterium]|nr:hypothetical protein [Bryobacteraceae bacterium]
MKRRYDLPLLVPAAFALFLVVVRACLQSATLDEADGYLGYCAMDWPSQFYATSGNHVLNSIVERFVTTVFGLSHLTFRFGAIIGASIYITAAYRLCSMLIGSAWVRWPLFVCLVYNPFILDYLIASRGYSLALGFLLTAILVLAQAFADENDHLYRRCALASLCVGLSFCANFAFAWVNASIMAIFLLWALFVRRANWYRLAGAGLLPAVLVTTAICGQTLLDWPKGQLYYGAATIHQMVHSLTEASFYTPNPQVANALVLGFLNWVAIVLPEVFKYSWIVLFLTVCALRIARTDAETRRESTVFFYLVGVLTLALSLYWLAHRALGILYPQERTASYFVVLATLGFGVAAACRYPSRAGAVAHALGIGVLSIGAVYFLGCLRISHFREWKFDAETQPAFHTLVDINRQYGYRDVVTGWEYTAALKFYEHYYGRVGLFNFIQDTDRPIQSVKPVYVLRDEYDHDYIEQQKLQVIYRGPVGGVVVAIRPSPAASH